MRKEIPAHLKAALGDLHYTAPLHLLHELDLGDGYFIRVIGDADNGCYEWVIERPHVTPYTNRPAIEYSDGGYCMSEVAFRDGLIAFYGLPNKVQQALRNCPMPGKASTLAKL